MPTVPFEVPYKILGMAALRSLDVEASIKLMLTKPALRLFDLFFFLLIAFCLCRFLFVCKNAFFLVASLFKTRNSSAFTEPETGGISQKTEPENDDAVSTFSLDTFVEELNIAAEEYAKLCQRLDDENIFVSWTPVSDSEPKVTKESVLELARASAAQILRFVDGVPNEDSVAVALDMVSTLAADTMPSMMRFEPEDGISLALKFARTLSAPVMHGARRSQSDIATAGVLELAKVIAGPVVEIAERFSSSYTACSAAICLVQTMAAPAKIVFRRLQPEETLPAAIRLAQIIASKTMEIVSKQPEEDALPASISLARGIFVETWELVQRCSESASNAGMAYLAQEVVMQTVCIIKPMLPEEAVEMALL